MLGLASIVSTEIWLIVDIIQSWLRDLAVPCLWGKQPKVIIFTLRGYSTSTASSSHSLSESMILLRHLFNLKAGQISILRTSCLLQHVLNGSSIFFPNVAGHVSLPHGVNFALIWLWVLSFVALMHILFHDIMSIKLVPVLKEMKQGFAIEAMNLVILPVCV